MSTARPPANSALVELQGVSVVFGGKVRALDDVTLTIAQGDIVGLVGESGSGKTTLCRAIVGLTLASSGEVRLNGKSVAGQLTTNPLAFRRQVQMLLQDAVAMSVNDVGLIPIHFQVVTWAARKGVTYIPRIDERTYAHQFISK